MSIPYEPTRSYVYQATRYELLPKLEELAKGFGDAPFRLIDLWKPLLKETYTQEQLDTIVPKAQSDGSDSLRNIFAFYIPVLAENLKIFERLGGGMFRNISLEDEIAEADASAPDIATDDDGIIYAYTFPMIRKENGDRFPIKIGLTTTGNAHNRIMQQCKNTSCFEYPVVLAIWRVKRVADFEDAIHSILAARGFKRDAPGTEWFNTTVGEIESAVMFIQPDATKQPI